MITVGKSLHLGCLKVLAQLGDGVEERCRLSIAEKDAVDSPACVSTGGAVPQKPPSASTWRRCALLQQRSKEINPVGAASGIHPHNSIGSTASRGHGRWQP